jgi:hypothetical protein
LQLRFLARLRFGSGLFLGLLFGLGLALQFRLVSLLLLLLLQQRLALGFLALLGGAAGQFHLGRRRLDDGLRLRLRCRYGLDRLLHRLLVPQLGFFAARRAALPLHAKVQERQQ